MFEEWDSRYERDVDVEGMGWDSMRVMWMWEGMGQYERDVHMTGNGRV